MNFEGFTPHEFNRWSSLVEQDDPTALPEGVAGVARNVTFRLNSVRTRDGIAWQFQTPTKDQPITGLASLINQQATTTTQVPLIFDMNGNMYVESPAGSGTLVKVVSQAGVVPSANAHMQVASAYNRGYLAFSDMKVALAPPAVYDLPSGNLDPFSMRPVGDRWLATTAYAAGEVITPNTGTTGNGHTYRCIAAGTSGASQPNFPTGDQATVVDGSVTWQENTIGGNVVVPSPLGINSTGQVVAGAGAFAAGRDVYITTFANGVGETTIAGPFIARSNTVANDRIVITWVSIPASWMNGLRRLTQ